MRSSSVLALALPALTLAQDQVPLLDKIKGFFSKTAVEALKSVPTSIPNPIDAGASKVASKVVVPLNVSNWRDVVTSSTGVSSADGIEDWFVHITGGNKTCFGFCGNTTASWNKAAALLAATPNSPNLGLIDCEEDPVFCNMWAAGPPAVYMFSVPKPLADQSTPATTVRYIPLSRNVTDGSEILELWTKQKYLDTKPYEGIWHPFDGLLAKTGLDVPVAYAMWGFAKMPSWLPMVAISFFSRSFMGRGRNDPQGGRGAAPPAAAS